MIDIVSDRAAGVGRFDTDTSAMGTLGDPQAIWILDQIERARSGVARWRKQAREADQFIAGHQFNPADLEQLRQEGRPCAAFNAAQKWLRFVAGLEQQAHTEVVFLERNINNQEQANAGAVATKLYEWAIQQCNGDHERNRAFDDMLRRGMGWTDTSVDRARDPAGLVELNRIDGYEMLWDVRARKPCVEDSRWVARERVMSTEEALMRWGKKHRGTILAAMGGQSTGDTKPRESVLLSEVEALPVSSPEWPQLGRREVLVTEFEWYDEVQSMHFFDPLENKEDWLPEDEFEEYRRRYRKVVGSLRQTLGQDLPPDIEHAPMFRRKYQRAVVLGRKIVSGPGPLPGDRFTFNCMTGQWDGLDEVWYGFARLLIDPQRYMTKFANQMMEIMTRSAKGGLLAEEDAFANPMEAEAQYARTGSITWVRPGKLTSVVPKEGPKLPEGSVQMFQVCSQMLREVTGINPEVSMGMGAGDVPMVTLHRREQANQLLLTQEFSSLRRYRFNEARTVFAFLRLIADDRWVRVGGPYDAQAVMLAKEPFFLEYDVIMEEGTRDPFVREQYLATLEKLAPTLLRTDNMMPELIDFLPLPASFKQAIKKGIEETAKARQEAAQKGLLTGGRGRPISQVEVDARARKAQADATRSETQARVLAERSQNDRMKTLMDAYLRYMELQQKSASAGATVNQTAEDRQRDTVLRLLEGASREALQVDGDIVSLLELEQQAREVEQERQLRAAEAAQSAQGGQQ